MTNDRTSSLGQHLLGPPIVAAVSWRVWSTWRPASPSRPHGFNRRRQVARPVPGRRARLRPWRSPTRPWWCWSGPRGRGSRTGPHGTTAPRRSCRPTSCVPSSAADRRISTPPPTRSRCWTRIVAAGRAADSPSSSTPSVSIDDRRSGYLALAAGSGCRLWPSHSTSTSRWLGRATPSATGPSPPRCWPAQQQRMRAVSTDLDDEGWDAVVRLGGEAQTEEQAPAQRLRPPPLRPATLRPTTDSATGPRLDHGSCCTCRRSRGPIPPGSWFTDLAQAAEEIGMSGLVADGSPHPDPAGRAAVRPDPRPVRGARPRRCHDPRLRLGTLVSPVTWRPAASLAKAAATLDELSGGRAFLGVGAGWWEREHAAAGLPFPVGGGGGSTGSRTRW